MCRRKEAQKREIKIGIEGRKGREEEVWRWRWRRMANTRMARAREPKTAGSEEKKRVTGISEDQH